MTYQPWAYQPIWVANERKRRALYDAQQQAQPLLRTGKPADTQVAQQIVAQTLAKANPSAQTADSVVQQMFQRNAQTLFQTMEKGLPLSTAVQASAQRAQSAQQQPAMTQKQIDKAKQILGSPWTDMKDKISLAKQLKDAGVQVTEGDFKDHSGNSDIGDFFSGIGGAIKDAGGDLLDIGKGTAPAMLRGVAALATGHLPSLGDTAKIASGTMAAADVPARDLVRPAIKRTTGLDPQAYIDNPNNPAGLRIALGAATDPTTYIGPGLVRKVPALAPIADVIGNPFKATAASVAGSAALGEVGNRVGGQTGETIGAVSGGIIGALTPATANLVRAAAAGHFVGVKPRPFGNRIIEDQGAGSALIHQIEHDAGISTAPLSPAEQKALAKLIVPDTGYQPSFGEAIPARSAITGTPIRWTQQGTIPGVGDTGYAEYFGAGHHGFEQPQIFVNDQILSRPPSDARDLLIRARVLPHEEAHAIWDQVLTPVQQDQVKKLLIEGDRNTTRAVNNDLASRWGGAHFDKPQEAFAEAWASRQSGQETPYSRLLGPMLDEVVTGLPAEQRLAVNAQRRQLTDWGPRLTKAMDVTENAPSLIPDTTAGNDWYWVKTPAGQDAGFVTRNIAGRYEVGLRNGERKTFNSLEEARQYVMRERNLMPFGKGAPETPDEGPRRSIPKSATEMTGPVSAYLRAINQGRPASVVSAAADDVIAQLKQMMGAKEVTDFRITRDGVTWSGIGRTGGRVENATLALSHFDGAANPRPLAKDRIWWHGTRDLSYELPDPEKATSRITQGPGVYMAADPTTSANYGHRLFANEFDGNVLDLTAKASTDAPIFDGGPTWQQYAQKVADRLNEAGVRTSDTAGLWSQYDAAAKKFGYDSPQVREISDRISQAIDERPTARITADDLIGGVSPNSESPFMNAAMRTADNGYGMRDRIAAHAYALLDRQPLSVRRNENAGILAGRFSGVAVDDYRELTKALINDTLAESGVDALFHHSPRADGDVLIVLNGDKARVRADIQPLDAYDFRNSTLEDIKAHYKEFGKGTVTQDTGDSVYMRSNGGMWEATDMGGAWSVTDPNDNVVATFGTKAEAVSYVTEGKYQRFYQQGEADPSKPTFVGMQPSEIADILGVPAQNKKLYDRLVALDEKFRLGSLTPSEAQERASASTTLRKFYADLNDGRSPVWVLPAGSREHWATSVQRRVDAMRQAGWSDAEIHAAIPDAPMGGPAIQSSKSAPKGSHTVAEYIGQQKYARMLQLEKIASNPGVDADVRQQARQQMHAEFGADVMPVAQPQDLEAQLQASLDQRQLMAAPQPDAMGRLPGYGDQPGESNLSRTMPEDNPPHPDLYGQAQGLGEPSSIAALAPGADAAAAEPAFPGMEPPKVAKPIGQRTWVAAKDLLNVPRATLSSMDFSQAMRQNYILGIQHPGEYRQSIVDAVKAAKSEDNALAMAAARQSDPDYRVLVDNGWYERKWGAAAAKAPLENRDERFMSSWVSRIPGLRASERSFSEGVNSLTWAVSKGVLEEMRAAVPNGLVDPAALRQRLELINALAGRGKVPEFLQSGALNATFFSPRFLASRVQIAGAILSKDPAVRKQAATALASFIGVNGAILGMAAAAGQAGIIPGLSVGLDPAKNLGKVTLGNTSYDFWAGYAPIVRFVYQLASNDAGYGNEQGKLTTLGKFARSKLAPVPAAVIDILKGEAPSGTGNFEANPGGIAETVYRAAAPLFFQQVADQLKSGNVAGAAKTLPEFVGVSSNTYQPRSAALDEKAQALAAANPADYPDGVSGFYDLAPKDRQAIKDQNPDVWKAYMQDASGPSAKAEAVRVELEAKQKTIDAQLLNGEIPANDWLKQYQALRDELRYRKKEIYSGQASAQSNLDPRMKAYYAQLEGVDNGTLTWDDVDAWMAAQPAADQKYIQQNTGLGGTPLVRAFKAYQQEYYDLPKYRGFTADEGAAIDELAAYARSYAQNDAGRLAALNVIAAKNPRAYSPKVVSAARRMLMDSRLGPQEDPRRAAYRKKNPAMAALLQRGYLDPRELNLLKQQIAA